jgi:hypothetical protein
MAALFMGLGPTILGAVFGIHNVGVDGATSSIEPLVAAVAALFIGSVAAHKTLIVGTVSVIVGAALVIVATATGVLPLLLLGGAVGGVGFGATFLGALRGWRRSPRSMSAPASSLRSLWSATSPSDCPRSWRGNSSHRWARSVSPPHSGP